jgi:murein endopeptidase
MRDAAARTPETLQPTASHSGASGLTAKRLARLALGALLGLGACGEVMPSSPGSLRVVDTPAELPAPLPVQAMHFEPNAAALPLLTTTPEPTDRPRDVFWTAREPKTVQQLASEWGLALSTLTELNPELTPEATLAEGTRLKVWQFDPENPPMSIGSPNRGKLRNGMPFPEGDSWRLRPVRRRAYGTETTVTSLVEAFQAYGEQFPDSPKIRVGEIAKRTGGRVAPHASHRSGRDVDIGYIFRGADNENDHFRQMSARNFDAEKNWVLIQEILKSGKVQTIYVSKKLQKLLHAEAAKTLSAPELAALFEYPRTESSPHATLQHWKGHADHMHVRFQCEPGNRRCRSRGR